MHIRDRIFRKINQSPICGIYRVLNTVNNKVYVGQSIDIERRWAQHKYGGGNLILRNAIKKYGIDNFEFDILETIDVNNKAKEDIVKDLIILEQKWFNLIKPFTGKNGYNIQKTSKPNLTANRDKNFGEKISKIKIDNNHTGKPLIQYNLNGDIVNEWNSCAQVERNLGFNAENISACCLKKSKTSNGFVWRFKNDLLDRSELEELRKRKKPIKRKICQLTINNEIVKIWGSLKEISDELKFDIRLIKNCCNTKRVEYKGFKWIWYI